MKHCPYLGLADDAETKFSFPSRGNFCHCDTRPYDVPLGHQSQFCLSENYVSCIVFLQLDAGKWPAKFTPVEPQTDTPPPRTPWPTIVAGLALVVILLLAGAAALNGSTVGSEPTAAATAVLPASETPLAAVERATASPTPEATLTTSPTALPEPSSTATETSLPTIAPTQVPTIPVTPTAISTPTPVTRSSGTLSPTETPTPAAQVLVISDRVNIRFGPGFDYTILATVDTGTTYAAIGRVITDDWIEICCLGNGASGWLFLDLVELNVPVESLPAVLDLPPLPTETPVP